MVLNAREITQYVKCTLFSKRLLTPLKPVMLLGLLRSLRTLRCSEPLRFFKSIIERLELLYLDVL